MENLLDLNFLIESFPAILSRLPVTIGIAVGSLLLSLIIGVAAALIKIYKVPVLSVITSIYISFIRGTPLLVQIYLVFYGIPKIICFLQSEYGWLQSADVNSIAPEFYALMAFSINLGAYLSETIRSAIESVDRGQFEAAKAIGMTPVQMMLKIVFPQALTVAIPNLGNMFISTIKDTSLVFIIGVIDIMGQAKILGSRGLAFFEVYIAVSIVYWILCIVVERLLAKIEKRARRYERGIA
ncbi:amino acid ABC transporter permease [Planococcus sp. CP5-4]|uniref:amino acid ABC transporter permease n=1 Tax=unclassified Planococcus (in: firmicutes) TaxID=2662419 RepID=UPI001C23DC43|nr:MULTISPECIES: amino acid ABC transporter permease [unclassified Planococcus (in: firmicutes)]MBU9674236.1 amino acid ABC transporter permease [Planococcus sp. CP5-4_YE]MBV0909292.1 amino acid ABC transporter permease [Planococcus sp. CP5-4_UN]MBW6063784.1 amino acid ABC transporter permease [Planococcus sp. CP5-4]